MSASLDAAEGPAYFAVYQCQARALNDFRPAAFPYVTAVHAITRIQSVNFPGEFHEGIVVEFRDRAGFEAMESSVLEFLRTSDVQAALIWCGVEQASIQQPKPKVPWYQPFTAKWALFATLVSAIGVIDAARNHWLEFFEPAEIVGGLPEEAQNVLGEDPWGRAEKGVRNLFSDRALLDLPRRRQFPSSRQGLRQCPRRWNSWWRPRPGLVIETARPRR